jgi:hypothetical protein
MDGSGGVWDGIVRGKVKDKIVLHLMIEKEFGKCLEIIGVHVTQHPRCKSHPHTFKEFVIAPIRSGAPLAMTAITRNFPWFIKDLGVSIIGQVRTGRLPEHVSDVD